MTAPCKLLCVGDVHLGRLPTRVPADVLAELGRSLAELGPAEGLRRAVELALEERVDAVLFAGDVVESADDFFEAYPRLKTAVGRLVEGGVDVVAVAGNHDVQVLPRLAGEVPDLTLLGRGGRWESHLVRRAGTPLARVVGWSFPEPRVYASPLARYPAEWSAGRYADGAPDGLPTVGLLHADLEASGGAYAPVARVELAARPLAGWLLGHVHAPSVEGLAAPVPIGYLGSLVGLDPGEAGARGPWRATLDAAGLRLEHAPLAPLRYERRDLALDGLDGPEALDAALLEALREAHRALGPELGAARAVALRLRLTGTRRVTRAELERQLERALASGVRDEHEGVRYFLERARDDTRPERDLAELARGSDPAGLLARRLLALEAANEEGRALVARAAAALRADPRLGHPGLSPVAGAPPTEDELRPLLVRVARAALDELLAETAPEPESAPAAPEVPA